MCVCVCVCVVRDKKERWVEEGWGKGLEKSIYVTCMYVSKHVCVHIHTYVYIYILRRNSSVCMYYITCVSFYVPCIYQVWSRAPQWLRAMSSMLVGNDSSDDFLLQDLSVSLVSKSV